MAGMELSFGISSYEQEEWLSRSIIDFDQITITQKILLVSIELNWGGSKYSDSYHVKDHLIRSNGN